MIIYDQLNRKLEFTKKPSRIVSLVPSLTELLVDLGLDLVACTRFCIHPEEKLKRIPRVGGTKDFDVESIIKCKPDIVIANKEENAQDLILELEKYLPVYVSDIQDLNDAYGFMKDMGDLFHVEREIGHIIDSIKESFSGFVPLKSEKTVLYLIWKNPYIGVGASTFINSLLEECHFKNIINENTPGRYPELDLSQLGNNPDFVFLSSEPYPFREKHKKEIQSLLPNSKVLLVNGELFSWYGSRLIKSANYFKDLLKNINF